MDAGDDLRGAEANPGGAVADQIAPLQLQVAQLTQMLQSGVKRQVQDNAEVWETANVVYVPFNFGSVTENERKYIRLLAKELGKADC